MRKLILPAAGTLVLLAGMWSLEAGSSPHVDPVVSGSIAKAAKPAVGKLFSLSNIQSDTACLASRGERLTNHSMRFVVSADCAGVWPGLPEAVTWVETGDGTVVVADLSGDAILTLVEADGLSYEVLDPPNALITVSAAN